MLQILISDDLVKCEKIGSGNFYWSFLSDTLMQLQKRSKMHEQSIPGLEKLLCKLEADVGQESLLREDSEERFFMFYWIFSHYTYF